MAKQDERFIKVLNEGSTWTTNREIWVDKTTGVNYLWIASGNAGGLAGRLSGKTEILRRPDPAARRQRQAPRDEDSNRRGIISRRMQLVRLCPQLNCI